MKLKILPLVILALSFQLSISQNELQVFPTNWWIGMKNPKLQLMIYSPKDSIQKNTKAIINDKDVVLDNVSYGESNKYIFLDLDLSQVKEAKQMKIKIGDKEILYSLEARNAKPKATGLSRKDVIYLIMPDRFADGDPSNNNLEGFNENRAMNSRDSIWGRHGGDFQGIINHMDYFNNLGVTALWLNPIVENDEYFMSYHGYAFTDHYQVDKRLGGNDMYKKAVDEAHAKGLKIIQDIVYNHIGSKHFFMRDLPFADWINVWDSYTNSNHRHNTIYDPNSTQKDKKEMLNGWFVPTMIDLNHNNPYLATYLIQNAIWYVEEFGIDGFRVDTYPYNDLEFMNQVNTALTREYPNLFIFGEAWENNVPGQAYFAKNNIMLDVKSNLESVTDFMLSDAIKETLKQESGWHEGIGRIYTVLSQDFLYQNPSENVIFLDNHDITRFFTEIGENLDKWKLGMTLLLTMRGIPEIYYGTEILMTGSTYPTDAFVREDFPGGWEKDKINKFYKEGRNKKEQEAFEFLQSLINIRKTKEPIHEGTFKQYIPRNNSVYCYKYVGKDNSIYVLMNASDKKETFDAETFFDLTTNKISSVLLNTHDRNLPNDFTAFEIQGNEAFVFEVKHTK